MWYFNSLKNEKDVKEDYELDVKEGNLTLKHLIIRIILCHTSQESYQKFYINFLTNMSFNLSISIRK